MYKQVETDVTYQLENEAVCEPVATLAGEYGGRCQIGVDDHCYVLSLRQENGKYRWTTHIFPEAFAVLATLPQLTGL